MNGQWDKNYKYTEESSTHITLGSCSTLEKPKLENINNALWAWAQMNWNYKQCNLYSKIKCHLSKT